MHCRSDEAIDAASAGTARKPQGLLTTASDEPFGKAHSRRLASASFAPWSKTALSRGSRGQQPPPDMGQPYEAPGRRRLISTLFAERSVQAAAFLSLRKSPTYIFPFPLSLI